MLFRSALGVVSPLAAGTYSVQAFFGPGGPLALPTDPVYAASSSGTTQITVLPASAGGLQTLVQSLDLQRGLAIGLNVTAGIAGNQFAHSRQKQGCDALDTFARLVFDSLGSDAAKLTPVQARLLVALDLAAETGYGCLPTGSTLPAAEQAIVGLESAIVAAAAPDDLRAAAADLGKTALKDTRDACRKVADLQERFDRLPASQSATIGAELTIVRLDLGC